MTDFDRKRRRGWHNDYKISGLCGAAVARLGLRLGCMMAGVRITIPGRGGQIEARKARLATLVAHKWNVVTATRKAKPGRPSAGDNTNGKIRVTDASHLRK
jgi:hypothetical protein